jgi:hypothetical protein
MQRALLALSTLFPLLLAASPARADVVVYDNTTTEIGPFNGGTAEFGDEIVLAPGPRTVTRFDFLYQTSFTPDGDETIQIRFYANDGAAGAPGTLLYDSGLQPIASTGFAQDTFTLSDLTVEVPNTFTWTYQFAGLDGGFGLAYYYEPPTVGSSDPLHTWMWNGASWVKISTSARNLAARVEAVYPVPSLGIPGLALLVGALVLAGALVLPRGSKGYH